ncbi:MULTISPECIES: ABC transporter permease [unclassified Methanopyrus]|uniref:ABC transporter permease n=1 Tax=Methanopyrus sp. SNP6 TaxID=1937005 RepID=UPI0011E5A856|nr:ABC transporter permease [Methanopyrus sp. SNP6]
MIRNYDERLETLLKVSAPVAVLAIWQAVSGLGLINPVLLPPPSQVFSVFVDMPGEILKHAITSLYRVAVGYSIAAVAGVSLGVLMGTYRTAHAAMDLLIEIVRPIPPIAWIPLAIVWFGIGDPSAFFIIFVGSFFPILINTISGIKGVDRIYIEAALNLGADDTALIRHVLVPGALPSIFTGLRVGLGVGWMCVVAAEMIAAKSGLGYMIIEAQRILATDQVIAGMITIGLLGLVMDRGFRYFERRALAWK